MQLIRLHGDSYYMQSNKVNKSVMKREREKRAVKAGDTNHFHDGSFPGNGFLQLLNAE